MPYTKLWLTKISLTIPFSYLSIAKDIQRCKAGDNDCIVAESNRVLHSYSNGHTGLNLIKVDPLHISDITLKQGSESPVNIELNFKETDLVGLHAHNFYYIK